MVLGSYVVFNASPRASPRCCMAIERLSVAPSTALLSPACCFEPVPGALQCSVMDRIQQIDPFNPLRNVHWTLCLGLAMMTC